MDEELDSDGGNKDFICRFCNRRFSKSQGLGGHMNGHRRERDNENYQKARELVEQNGGSHPRMMNNQYVAPQNNSSIPGVQAHVDLSSQSQFQTWAQTGFSSLSTYSNKNVGGVGPTSYSNQNVVGVGPTAYLSQQQQAFAQNLGDHTDYQVRETCPSLPYQRNNNLQTGASLLNNSGISGPYLPMKSHLQIRGPSFPTSQGGNPNLYMNGYAAVSASEKQQQPSFPTSQGGNPNLYVNGYAAVSGSEQQQPSFPTSQGGNPNLYVNGYAGVSASEQQRPSFPTSQGGNPNLYVNGYAAVSASEQQQPSFPTSQGGNPNLSVNGYAAVSGSEQQQPSCPTSQGGNPNLYVNGYAAVLASEQQPPSFPTSQGGNVVQI